MGRPELMRLSGDETRREKNIRMKSRAEGKDGAARAAEAGTTPGKGSTNRGESAPKPRLSFPLNLLRRAAKCLDNT